MTWELRLAPSFVKSLRKLHPNGRSAVERFLVEYEDGIDDPQAIPNLKRLLGHETYYRIRFGAYRVGIELDHERCWVILRYVGRRGDFYKHFP